MSGAAPPRHMILATPLRQLEEQRVAIPQKWRKRFFATKDRSPFDLVGFQHGDCLTALLRHFPLIVYLGFSFWRKMCVLGCSKWSHEDRPKLGARGGHLHPSLHEGILGGVHHLGRLVPRMQTHAEWQNDVDFQNFVRGLRWNQQTDVLAILRHMVPSASKRKERPEHYKIVVLGACSGKTALIRRYVHNAYSANTRRTLGVDFALKTLPQIQGQRNEKITLQLWDLASPEIQGSMTRLYYTAAAAAVIVYDASRPETLAEAARWKLDLDEKAVNQNTGLNVPCVLFANKTDLASYPAKEEIDHFCAKHGFESWFRVSAESGRNVAEAFESVADLASTECLRIPEVYRK